MAVTDPADARLLRLLAEMGRAPVRELATRCGMDVREAAARLAALSSGGLPLGLTAECDPQRVRAALGSPPPRPAPASSPPQQPPPHPPAQVGPPSGPIPAAPAAQPPAPVASDPVSTWGPPQTATWARNEQAARSDQPAQGDPQARAERREPTSPPGPAGTAAGQQQGQPADQPPRQPPGQAPSRPLSERPSQSVNQPPYQPVGQAPNQPVSQPLGQPLTYRGPDAALRINVVGLADPADFLFTAAGYRLGDGERAVLVQSEVTNLDSAPYPDAPDQHLVLITDDGRTVAKAPVTLSSRPPYRTGVGPGQSATGHTVYLVGTAATIHEVRWQAGENDGARTLSWRVTR